MLSFRSRFGCLAPLVSLLCLGAPSAARAASSAAFDLGLNYYGSDVGKSLTGATGYFMHFQVKSGKRWIFPTFGAALEYMSGEASLDSGPTEATLVAGQIEGGVEIMPMTAYVRPFISAQALLGWASLNNIAAETRSLALTYGFVVSGGTEIRLSSKEDAKGIRIRTAYRFLTGNIENTSGFQLNALQIGIGMVF